MWGMGDVNVFKKEKIKKKKKKKLTEPGLEPTISGLEIR